MPKAGNLKSTFIVTSDDLKVNGGRWLLQSGPAIRVRGFNSTSIGDRRIIGGDALPIYILSESDARANGGQFLLKDGQPIQVTDVIGSARGAIQGKAIPVFPVDDDGNFDPLWGSYAAKVLATQPSNLIAYWPLWESGGAVAEDISGNARHGAYTAVALGQPGIGDGNTAPAFDGATSLMDFDGASFRAAFDGQEGSLIFWAQVSAAGIWTEGVTRNFTTIQVNANNTLRLFKQDNLVRWSYEANGIQEDFNLTPFNPLTYFCMGMTWSLTAGVNGELRGYINGIQQGATQDNLGTWAGVLQGDYQIFGAFNDTPLQVFSGQMAHGAFWNIALTPAEMLNIGVL